jgi:hypothetical protein
MRRGRELKPQLRRLRKALQRALVTVAAATRLENPDLSLQAFCNHKRPDRSAACEALPVCCLTSAAVSTPYPSRSSTFWIDSRHDLSSSATSMALTTPPACPTYFLRNRRALRIPTLGRGKIKVYMTCSGYEDFKGWFAATLCQCSRTVRLGGYRMWCCERVLEGPAVLAEAFVLISHLDFELRQSYCNRARSNTTHKRQSRS